MHWGDGARSSQLDTATFLRHAWTAPGTYKVFMTSGCSGSQGSLSADTSNRLTLTIADSAQPGKVRTVSGPRMASETWSPDTLYQIVGKTVFEAQTTLTILPGTKVFIANDADYLQILGGLHAVGTEADSIRFEGEPPGAHALERPHHLQFRWQLQGGTPFRISLLSSRLIVCGI